MVKLKNESNMKTIFKTIACLSAALLAYSCVLNEIDTQITDEEAIAQIRLECDALESYTMQSQKPQAVSFRVNSTTPWEITGFENSWLTVEPASSKVSSLSEDITVKATGANSTLSDRSITLTVKGANTTITHSIVITQMRMGQLTVEPVVGDYDKAGATKTFTVSSNISWEASAADDWLTLNPSSGTSDGPMKTVTVSAEAAANKSLSRSTVVTVVSGDEKTQFFVKQDGHTLEFQQLESPVIDRKGGELLFTVNSTLDWKVESSNENFTATKVSDTQVKVSAPFNSQFAERKATIILKPTSDEYGDVSGSTEVSQGVNFTFSGKYDILDDGSIKIYCSDKTRVTTIDNYRFVKMTLILGDVSFEANGQLWAVTKGGGDCNLYNQLTVGGTTRLRTDGTLPNCGKSSYKNATYELSLAEANAMKKYRFEILPDYEHSETNDAGVNVPYHYMRFYYNDEETPRAVINYRSGIMDDPTAENPYRFGVEDKTTASWYVVKSCVIEPVAEQ